MDSGTDPSVEGLVRARLAHQVGILREQGSVLVQRLDLDDSVRARAVHDVRVACRRLRTVLALQDLTRQRATSRVMQTELTWLGGALAEARDLEVARDRLLSLLRTEHGGRAPSAQLDQLMRLYDGLAPAAWRPARSAWGSARHDSLMAGLDDLVLSSPSAVAPTAEDVLTGFVLDHWTQLDRSVLRGEPWAPPPDTGRDRPARARAAHRVRKAARRLRYAAETVQRVWPPAAGLVRPATDLSARLGERQDTVLTRQLLAVLVSAGEEEGDGPGPWARLSESEGDRAWAIDAEVPALWGAVADAAPADWRR